MTRAASSTTTVEPIATEETGVGGREATRYTHPCFATVRASRINGDSYLFNSKVRQQGYIQISIQTAELVSGTYEDHVYGHGPAVLEFAMTESQWVEFISRMNIGSGTPCTLQRRWGPNGYEMVPGLPYHEDAVERLIRGATEMGQKLDDETKKAIEDLRVISAALPKGKQAEVARLLERITSGTASNLEFSKSMLNEHAEKLVTAGKIEVNAMANGIVRGLGLKSISELAQLARSNPEFQSLAGPQD